MKEGGMKKQILYCRRCGKRRRTFNGKCVSSYVGSSKYGQGEVILPNPICIKCFNDFGDYWYKYIHMGIRA